jgi:pyridoxine 5-phosphate synthase
MIRLGVNVDHVATLRNARGEKYPDPLQAALIAQQSGADNITCHLREDRRHIKDRDLRAIKEVLHIPLNFEMATTDEMIKIACEVLPHSVTLVPERRQELTTEGGLNVAALKEELQQKVFTLKGHNILVSLFIEADQKMIELSHEVGADAIEIHTGRFCHNMAEARRHKEQWDLVKPFIEASLYAHSFGMQVHFGHGLNYHNAHWMQVIPHCEEANIGHAIISQALFTGLERAVRDMKDLLNNPAHRPYDIPE